MPDLSYLAFKNACWQPWTDRRHVIAIPRFAAKVHRAVKTAII